MDDLTEKSGGRAATRAQIVATFNRLMLEGDKDRPRVAEIVAEAGVARSTFYDHFDGVEALFDESLSSLLGRLAQCLVSDGSADGSIEELNWLLAHIYENRERGRALLSGPGAERTEALLARLLAANLVDHSEAKLHAILIAGTVVAALGAWVTGQISVTPEKLAKRLLGTSRAILNAN